MHKETAKKVDDPVQRQEHIKDATDFFNQLDHGRLPAVSYLKPDSFDDGHPASSKLDLLESMMTRVVEASNAIRICSTTPSSS